jgi:pimeloyl-ACP methyl ester carboxylesterase
LPGEPVDAIGFSLGARTLLVLASRDPSRFRRIIVAGVGANLFRDDARNTIVDAVRGTGDASNPVVGYFAGLARTPGNDPDALVACMSSQRAPLGTDELAKVTNDVLVVLGDRDFAGPADPLVDALPSAKLVTLNGADHFSTPKEFRFIDAALEFLGVEL